MIGKENLPNVYVDTIILADDSEGIRINVFLSMFDSALRRTWYDLDQTTDLKIKVRLSSDPTESSRLISGELSLFSIPGTERATKILSISEGQLIDYEQDVQFNKYQYLATFYNVKSLENLNVFASAFLDFNRFSGNNEFNKFYGPMVGESIFESGQVNQFSRYFVFAGTEEEYVGPVHQHNDSYMEGSMHTNKPHRLLTLIEEENFKIIDNRD